jgi:hypothetical protein
MLWSCRRIAASSRRMYVLTILGLVSHLAVLPYPYFLESHTRAA